MQLSAQTILITQTHPNHLNLATQATKLGANIISKACMQIQPIAISNMRAQAIAQADCWVFLSSHAVRHGLANLKEYYQGQYLISIGPSTADILAEHNLAADAIAQPYNSDGIYQLEYFEKNRNIAIFTGKNSPKKLYSLLKKQGHTVYQYPAYRRLAANPATFQLSASELANITLITSHSKLSLEQLQNCIITAGYTALYQKTLVVVTEQMATLAKKIGFNDILISKNPTAKAIIECINSHTKAAKILATE